MTNAAMKVVEKSDRIRELEKEAISLKLEAEAVKRELKTCANELCLRCGNYAQEHIGACNGCRWLSARHGGMPT